MKSLVAAGTASIRAAESEKQVVKRFKNQKQIFARQINRRVVSAEAEEAKPLSARWALSVEAAGVRSESGYS